MERINIPGLSTYEYEHPFDRKALDRLEDTRGLDLLTRKVLDKGLEKYLWIKHTGDHVKVTQKAIPEVYNLLTEASGILQIPEIPELYIFLEDKIQTFSVGEKRKLIALSSGSLELLNETELMFLIGRELGHIKSNHVMYRMMADSLQVISRVAADFSMGISNWLSMPIQTALLHWYRMSEFTADRAGLLACQDHDAAVKAFIKMAGLPRMYNDRVSVEDFREQAKAFEGIKESGFDRFIRFAAVYESNQPFTVIRTSQLDQWVKSGTYDRILMREVAETERICANPHCRQHLDPEDKFCAYCGESAMPQLPEKPSLPLPAEPEEKSETTSETGA